MDPEAPTAPDALQVEILRESERVLDRQLETMVELDRKTERMMALAVAALAAEVAAFVYAVERLAPVPPVWRPLAIGSMLLTMAGILLFVDAYMGFRNRARPKAGPSPRWLAVKANDASWSPVQHFAAVTVALARQFSVNEHLIGKGAASRRLGLFLVLTGVALHTGVALYVF